MTGLGGCAGLALIGPSRAETSAPKHMISAFAKRLKPLGRILDLPGYFVWCQAPIFAPDGRVHVFFSRWRAEKRMSGWLNGSEIAHAVADHPGGPYEVLGTVLEPRGPGFWDGTTCHNPHINQIGDRYALFYMGNCNGRTDTKRIGVAVAHSLNGPWKRSNEPLLQPGAAGSWDDHCTTNPSLIVHSNGEYWLYYKSWNTADYAAGKPPVRGNRKYGLAIAKTLEGPYVRHLANPLVDFSGLGGNRQCEDAFVWHADGRFHMIVRDMGVFSHEEGLIMQSDDGLSWSAPEIAYHPLRTYITEPVPAAGLSRYGRLERPQLLMRDGHPAFLFTATQGSRHGTSSGFVFQID